MNKDEVILDFIALAEHKVSGRADNWDGPTQAQLRAAIADARKLLCGDGTDEVFFDVMQKVKALRAENERLLAALKRAEYFITGQDYLDGLNVIRNAIKEN